LFDYNCSKAEGFIYEQSLNNAKFFIAKFLQIGKDFKSQVRS